MPNSEHGRFAARVPAPAGSRADRPTPDVRE